MMGVAVSLVSRSAAPRAAVGQWDHNGERSTFSVKVGDRVLFTAYGGTEVKYSGEEYLIMREEDILGVIA